MHRNKKKGITLTEICVALAVLSIISVVVVSFAAMVTGRGATGTDKLKYMQDIELLEAMVEDWFEAVYTGVGSVTVATDAPESTEPTDPSAPTEPFEKHTWLQTAEGKTLQYVSQNLVAVFDEGVPLNVQLESITGVEFEVEPGDNDELFFCTVTYVYRQGQNKEVEKTYTFCINPRVGESIS